MLSKFFDFPARGHGVSFFKASRQNAHIVAKVYYFL